MGADHLPRDRHGHPYQVILVLLPGGGTEDLRRDATGRALAWVRDEHARPIAGPDGEPPTEPVPAEVQAEAERAGMSDALVTRLDESAAGRLEAKRSRVFRFDEIREAHRVMEANQAGGKMVVVHG